MFFIKYSLLLALIASLLLSAGAIFSPLYYMITAELTADTLMQSVGWFLLFAGMSTLSFFAYRAV